MSPPSLVCRSRTSVIQLQGTTVFGGATSTAVPVRNQVSISEANSAAAAACVGCGEPSSEATFSGATGGTPVNVGSMPPAIVTAAAANAASNAEAAEGVANALASAPASADAAAATVVEAGMMEAA